MKFNTKKKKNNQNKWWSSIEIRSHNGERMQEHARAGKLVNIAGTCKPESKVCSTCPKQSNYQQFSLARDAVWMPSSGFTPVCHQQVPPLGTSVVQPWMTALVRGAPRLRHSGVRTRKHRPCLFPSLSQTAPKTSGSPSSRQVLKKLDSYFCSNSKNI